MVLKSYQSSEMSSEIRRILQEHRPPLEQEIKEYLLSMLTETNEASDSADIESLQSILEQFLDVSTTNCILSELSKGINQVDSSDTKTLVGNTTDTFLKKSSQGRRLDQSMLPTDSPPDIADTMTAAEVPGDTGNSMKQKELRKQRREAKKKTKVPATSSTSDITTAELIDDHKSAWAECQEEGKLWGGRGHGGRGVRYTGENYDNIHLPSVSLQFQGNELLVDSPMDIVRGHRYGLLGRNGVGKSTLLRELAHHGIPGLPHGMRTLLVQQQIEGRDDQTAVQALMEADTVRKSLLEEMERVEYEIEQGVNLEKNSMRMGDLVSELDVIGADDAEDRALAILKGLSFTASMLEGPTSALSGGWRMRLALAQALFVPNSDLILLDECTNHLDLQGVSWLIRFLTQGDKNEERTLIVVSHDRAFLDAICTDIIVMEHQRLQYHVGSFSDYQRQKEEKAAHHAQILDASEKQRSKALAFIQEHQNSKKSTDPNKQRQAKMIKDKKLDRIGNYREDGKRYKQFSMKKLDVAYVHLAQKVEIERDEAVLKIRFPNPTWPPGIPEGAPLVQLDGVSFGYDPTQDSQLKNLTLSICRGSKIALVGNNGCGKTTLIKLITGELDQKVTTRSAWRHPNLRFGHVTQYAVEELEKYSSMTVVQYAENVLSVGRVSSTIIKAASGNVRQYLGGFGLGGAHALRKIGTLSGGERMRLCFATVLADEPHLLFLDESTNHVDLETLDCIAEALRDYQGAVLMVSHNQGFLSSFCKELWVLEKGHVDISHNDTESFDDMFSKYRSHILSSSAATREKNRQLTATLAKKATSHATGARKGTTLFA